MGFFYDMGGREWTDGRRFHGGTDGYLLHCTFLPFVQYVCTVPSVLDGWLVADLAICEGYSVRFVLEWLHKVR